MNGDQTETAEVKEEGDESKDDSRSGIILLIGKKHYYVRNLHDWGHIV